MAGGGGLALELTWEWGGGGGGGGSRREANRGAVKWEAEGAEVATGGVGM